MNPWDLNVTELVVWGIVAHIVADLMLQNDWMAINKANRRQRRERPGDGMRTPPRMYQPPTAWWDRHPAAYLHAANHGVLLALVFGWVSLPLAVVHLLIDTRVPVQWWMRHMRQTGWENDPSVTVRVRWLPEHMPAATVEDLAAARRTPLDMLSDDLMPLGGLVRMMVDQAFHITTIAAAALLVAA